MKFFQEESDGTIRVTMLLLYVDQTHFGSRSGHAKSRNHLPGPGFEGSIITMNPVSVPYS